MALRDGDVAVLAEQVAELIGTQLESRIAVRIAPSARDDPYRWGARSWTVYFDVTPVRGDTIGVWVPASDSPTVALHRLVDGLGELSETPTFWGAAFPYCVAGHRHASSVQMEGTDVVLSCPETGEEVARLRPEVPQP
jgi:hypothetical protein